MPSLSLIVTLVILFQAKVPLREMSPAPQDKQHEFDLPPITVETSMKVRKVQIPLESPSNQQSDYHRFTLLQPSSTPELIQILPPITVGTGKKVRKVLIPSESPSNPQSDYERITLLQPSSTPQLIQILPPPTPAPPVQLHQTAEIKNVARSTKWSWQQSEKKTTRHFIKEYERRRQHLTYNCGKCGKPRTRDTNHHQYYGQQFCPSTATETYHEWRSSKEKCRLERKQQKFEQKLKEVDPK